MTDTASNTSDWLEIQRKYWEGWSEIGRKAMGLDQAPTNPWFNAIDHWWQAMAPAAPNDLVRDFMQKLVDQGKSFFGLTETWTKGLPGDASGDAAQQGWNLLSRTLDDWQKAFAGGQQDSDQTLRRLMAFWEMPLDNWQRTMSSLSPMPGDLLRNMPHDQVQDSMNRFLSAPGLGYTREEQAQTQDLIKKSLEYQAALREYTGFFAQLGVKSVERMRTFLQTKGDKGEPIESGRLLYDSWVACCEQVYAEEVSTAEYARIHGQLVNAQMALKQRMSIAVDETLGAMNMPTRSELRTLQDRLQETRRQIKQQGREIAQLKRLIDDKPVEAAAAPPPMALKQAPAATTRKRATTKPTTKPTSK
ncbi:class III poly(R)-hydroxyalkanoic acid synthase subunit PhaE [Thioalkalicoccus limnaeus]|uniref:Poly(3-hydroxyalkanoate) polymerase subunit PhaE n=1 Tax=Thioalkalicoccus limnaeus TaxID=120681 RepID=A0ABV4BH38_9GAMM